MSIPDTWVYTTLGELCRPSQYGWTTSAKHNGSGWRFLRTTDITSGIIDWNTVPFCEEVPPDPNKYRLTHGDVVISRAGSIGVSALIGDCPETVFASYLIRFQPYDQVVPAFIYYFLLSPGYWEQVRAEAAGIALQNINAKKLSRIVVPVAPRIEQDRIVAEIEKQFTRLDAAVAALKRTQANLKRYRASVLKAACQGRLVPTEAELARKEGRSYEPSSELLKRILAERRAKWEKDHLAKMTAAGKPTKNDDWKKKYKEPAPPDTSNLSALPEGWVWATTQQIGEVQLGRQRSPSKRSKNYPTKYIRAANITEKGLDLGDVLEMEFEPAEFERYKLQRGDVILSEASGSPGQVGKPAVWNSEMASCCFQNTVIRLRPMNLSSNYLLACFRHYYVSGMFSRIAGGVGINHLGAEKFSALAIPLPPSSEQTRIVSEVERCLSELDATEPDIVTQLRRTTSLRQSILKRAFEGNLVPQDSKDEPASVLLERIRAEPQIITKPPKSKALVKVATP